MKTERRHELQTNELADWIGVHTEKVKPYMKTIIGVTVLVIAGLFAIAMMRGQRQGRSQAAWTEYFAAAEMGDLEGLREIASRYQGTEGAAWAMQTVGDIEAASAARDLYVNKNDGREGLLLAKEAYTEAISASQESMLLQRAHMGLAQVYESMGEFDQADTEYQLVADTWPDSAIAKEALDRMRFLTDPSTVEFSQWFANQEPFKEDAMRQVLQGSAGLKPPSPNDDLPDIPELSLPSADELQRPIEMEMTPPETGVEEPEATETEESSTETPPETAPGESTSTESESDPPAPDDLESPDQQE
jgi:hypothetical protein